MKKCLRCTNSALTGSNYCLEHRLRLVSRRQMSIHPKGIVGIALAVYGIILCLMELCK